MQETRSDQARLTPDSAERERGRRGDAETGRWGEGQGRAGNGDAESAWGLTLFLAWGLAGLFFWEELDHARNKV
jgi:hypothetical protein